MDFEVVYENLQKMLSFCWHCRIVSLGVKSIDSARTLFDDEFWIVGIVVLLVGLIAVDV